MTRVTALAGRILDARQESADNHLVLVERVVEVGVDSSEVHAADAGCSSSSVNTSAWSRLPTTKLSLAEVFVRGGAEADMACADRGPCPDLRELEVKS
jgi:hypothetical protein